MIENMALFERKQHTISWRTRDHRNAMLKYKFTKFINFVRNFVRAMCLLGQSRLSENFLRVVFHSVEKKCSVFWRSLPGYLISLISDVDSSPLYLIRIFYILRQNDSHFPASYTYTHDSSLRSWWLWVEEVFFCFIIHLYYTQDCVSVPHTQIMYLRNTRVVKFVEGCEIFQNGITSHPHEVCVVLFPF